MASTTWSSISCALRLRVSPMRPVAQNAQSAPQPICDEMQSEVRPDVMRRMTASTRYPSAVRKSSFVAPSTAESRRSTSSNW